MKFQGNPSLSHPVFQPLWRILPGAFPLACPKRLGSQEVI